MQSDSQQSMIFSFLTVLGNLLLPGSVTPYVPGWDAEAPSQQFFFGVAKFEFEIQSFRDLLAKRFTPFINELKEEDIQVCIAENSPATRIFFQTVGDLYIHEYYSRPQTLIALGLPIEPPFPKGRPVISGSLEKLETVFIKGKTYR